MTGEMTTVSREEWPIHFAIAEAVGGVVKPFDVYQGPYVLVGDDRVAGTPPYQVCYPGPVRLWVQDFNVYREDTDELEEFIDEATAVEVAQYLVEDVLAPTPPDSATMNFR